MLIKNKSEIHLGPHFMLNYELLQPGDIILERGYAWYSEKIAKHTNSRYSHAMIYVGGTIIEATREGANKQVISSQADSLIKISRIWADFFPANTSN